MFISPSKNKLYHVALTGYPSSGKSEIGEILASRAGYKHISTDMIRESLLDGKSIFDLEPAEWDLIFSEFQTRKHLYLRGGENVATDSCPHTNKARRVTMHVSPLLRQYLNEKNKQLERYLVVLRNDMEELESRNRVRGRKNLETHVIMDWISKNWEEPPSMLTDETGNVPVLQYENNTKRNQELILKDLGKRIGVELL